MGAGAGAAAPAAWVPTTGAMVAAPETVAMAEPASPLIAEVCA